jgi:hypothetical protein
MATPEIAKSHRLAYESNPLRLVKPSWEGFKLNWTAFLLWVISLILAAVAGLAVLFSAGLVFGLKAGVVFALIMIIPVVVVLALYFGPAIYRITLAMARREQIMFTAAFSKDWRLGGRLMLTQMLAGLVTILGFIALVIPGLFCVAWFAAVPYVVMEEELWGMRAMSRSQELAGGRIVDIWGTISLGSVAGVLVFIPVIGWLGSIIASMVLQPVVAIRYYQLKDLKAGGGETKAKTNVWNYVVIVLAIAVNAASFVAGQQNSKTHSDSNPVEKSSGLY